MTTTLATLGSLALVVLTWQLLRAGRARLLVVPAVLVLALAGLAAVAAPASTFGLVRRFLIGEPRGAVPDFSVVHRLIAVWGPLLALLVLRGIRRYRGENIAPPRAVSRVLLGLPIAALVALNICSLLGRVTFVLWSWAFLAAGAFALAHVVVHLRRDLRERRQQLLTSLHLSLSAGAAYGLFSALWHCCPPLWESLRDPVSTSFFLAQALVVSAIAHWSTPLRAPFGEAVGGLLFAAVYPWHSTLWFVQCVLAGALLTAITRRTAVVAPAVALGMAFLTHITLPFLGCPGVGAAALLFALLALPALRRPLHAPEGAIVR